MSLRHITMKSKRSQNSSTLVEICGQKAESNHQSDTNSSSESVLEIRLNEYVKKSEISDFDVRALVVRCSSCGRQINHYSNKDCRKHRKLDVITCKECYEFYGSSEFSQDESGYNYCTWCGNGGKLIVCDYCPNGFCNSCIRRNFGRSEISVTTREGWKCYCCNKNRLKPKIKFCNLIMNSTEKYLKKGKKVFQNTNKSISEDWLQAAFDESDVRCKNFHKKMSKLRAIGVNKSKSLKHIVKKMEEIINSHKTDLKNVSISLIKQYEAYMELQVKLNENKSDSDCVVLDEDQTNKVPPSGELSDASISLLPTQNDTDKYEKKIQAKMSLLKSSSESEDADTIEPANENISLVTDSQCNELSSVKNGKVNSPDIPETKGSNLVSSFIEISSVSESKAKRRLSFDFSDSSDNDFNIGKPNVDELLENVNENLGLEDADEILNKKNEEKSKVENIQLDPETDPKLKMEPKVDLVSCDHLFKDGETYLKIGNEIDVEDQLDKLVDNLCKFPLEKKKSVLKKKQKCGPLCSKKAAAKKELMESSSSISLSSEEDEDQKKIKIGTKSVNNPVANLEEKQRSSDSSSDLLSFGSDEEVRKPKKSKASKKVESSDSSDDFVPSRKRKYDKLLHGALLSDEEKKPKEKKEKKGPIRKKRLLSSDEEKHKKRSDKSDSTTSSDDEENSRKKKQPKKRRRIKQINSSSDEHKDEDVEEDEENENQDNTPGKGRKNIRKIVSQKKLAESTKEAQLEEKERKRRIFERQKLYNKIEDMSVDGKEVITRKMVLEVDQDSKEEIVEIHPDLVSKLKPHQVNGVKFMWECTIETVKDLDKPGSGCILAHCMGLGKTLQVIAFLHTCLTNPIVSKTIKRAMIICPYNTALNWASEFDIWLEDVEGDIKVHQLTNVKSNFERMDILKYWFVEGGVVILSYDMFRRLSADKIGRMKTKEKKLIHKHLLDPGPDVIVCDEGHVLKNDKSAISVATNKLCSRRRIVLTGTPLQNNLKEYHCMLSFVKPNLLGTTKEFRNRFVNPIINGQYDDSNQYDVKLMKKRIHILHKLLEGCVQRCDYSALTKFLPAKHEFVISVKLSEVQIKMYKCYLERRMSAQKDMKIVGKSLFIDFNNLRCIWTHPYICHVSHQRAEYKRMFKYDSEEEFVNDVTESSSQSSNSSTSDEDKVIEKIEKDSKKEYRTRSRAAEDPADEVEEVTEDVKQWYHEFISDDDKCNLELSGKMVLLMDILRECETIGDKIIVFSQSLLALDCIEDMLEYCASQPVCEEDKVRDAIGTWKKGLDYFRMDGRTSVDFRKNYIDVFNDPTNDRSRLFLISTRAGSLGTNLVGANRVVIMDTSWNPSHDVQAIFRVYRFGQIKPVYIYRLLAQGTMEEKIYDRQVTKLSLSCRVVDEQQIDRHFSAADLAELYAFDPNATTNRPTPMVPKDRLLAEMLIKNKDWIVTYHEHDSLLQNQTEEDLTEEERQVAWTEYENEREGRTPIIQGQQFLGMNPEAFLSREPDFSKDYEGKFIPELGVVVTNIYNILKVQTSDPPQSLKFKENALNQIHMYRQALREKHVKVLRLKQEFCSRGTVPIGLNKYLLEVTIQLKATTDYVNNLITAIQVERAAKAKTAAQQQKDYFIHLQNMQRASNPQQYTYSVGSFPPNVRRTFVQNVRFPQFAAPGHYNMNNLQRNKQPTVTEVDDNIPESVENVSAGSKQSTVTIEEIL